MSAACTALVVSAPRSLGFFLHPDLSVHLSVLSSPRPRLAHSDHVLTHSSVCLGSKCSLLTGFFPCPDLSLCLTMTSMMTLTTITTIITTNTTTTTTRQQQQQQRDDNDDNDVMTQRQRQRRRDGNDAMAMTATTMTRWRCDDAMTKMIRGGMLHSIAPI